MKLFLLIVSVAIALIVGTVGCIGDAIMDYLLERHDRN